MIVCGIDEVGRGPVIGPMVLGCVLLDDAGRKRLGDLKVRDSKKVSPERRERLAPQIKECAIEWSLIKISPQEIDYLRKKISLNAIEAMKIAELLARLKNWPAKVIVDSPDPVADNFRERITKFLNGRNMPIPEIVAEHKADDRYIEVSAASIIAKVERDLDIEKLQQEYGEIGSGYLSDQVTRDYIRKTKRNGETPHFVRRSWNTSSATQTRLEEF